LDAAEEVMLVSAAFCQFFFSSRLISSPSSRKAPTEIELQNFLGLPRTRDEEYQKQTC